LTINIMPTHPLLNRALGLARGLRPDTKVEIL
jgi:hypothetical protein